MATLDTSFWRPFKLFHGSLENAYICLNLIICGLHNIEMVIQIQCILINMNTTVQITGIFDHTSGEPPVFSACAKASPIDEHSDILKFSAAKTFEWRKVTQDLRYGGPLEMLTIAKVIKINLLFRVQRKLFLQFAIWES